MAAEAPCAAQLVADKQRQQGRPQHVGDVSQGARSSGFQSGSVEIDAVGEPSRPERADAQDKEKRRRHAELRAWAAAQPEHIGACCDAFRDLCRGLVDREVDPGTRTVAAYSHHGGIVQNLRKLSTALERLQNGVVIPQTEGPCVGSPIAAPLQDLERPFHDLSGILPSSREGSRTEGLLQAAAAAAALGPGEDVIGAFCGAVAAQVEDLADVVHAKFEALGQELAACELQADKMHKTMQAKVASDSQAVERRLKTLTQQLEDQVDAVRSSTEKSLRASARCAAEAMARASVATAARGTQDFGIASAAASQADLSSCLAELRSFKDVVEVRLADLTNSERRLVLPEQTLFEGTLRECIGGSRQLTSEREPEAQHSVTGGELLQSGLDSVLPELERFRQGASLSHSCLQHLQERVSAIEASAAEQDFQLRSFKQQVIAQVDDLCTSAQASQKRVEEVCTGAQDLQDRACAAERLCSKIDKRSANISKAIAAAADAWQEKIEAIDSVIGNSGHRQGTDKPNTFEWLCRFEDSLRDLRAARDSSQRLESIEQSILKFESFEQEQRSFQDCFGKEISARLSQCEAQGHVLGDRQSATQQKLEQIVDRMSACERDFRSAAERQHRSAAKRLDETAAVSDPSMTAVHLSPKASSRERAPMFEGERRRRHAFVQEGLLLHEQSGTISAKGEQQALAARTVKLSEELQKYVAPCGEPLTHEAADTLRLGARLRELEGTIRATCGAHSEELECLKAPFERIAQGLQTIASSQLSGSSGALQQCGDLVAASCRHGQELSPFRTEPAGLQEQVAALQATMSSKPAVRTITGQSGRDANHQERAALRPLQRRVEHLERTVGAHARRSISRSFSPKEVGRSLEVDELLSTRVENLEWLLADSSPGRPAAGSAKRDANATSG